ncbi:NAD(P)/FAD-dependent oxidoreductase [Sphingobium sp.]|uniref:flavin-containing monooxygenase n=1 Tax=Sphingobium sp. TaxID=1912891 RepID=UPI0028BE4B41|nr:NAD(P)/FAD-dependent oxidoreductase [Sphingobium sp.]
MSLADAVDRADLNALRLALYQLTGDEDLAAMRTEGLPVWGGVFTLSVLAPEHHDEVKRRALAYLEQPRNDQPPQPDRQEAERLMQMFSGRALTANELRFGYEELAFDPHPRGVEWRNKPAEATLSGLHATIVGGGISGMAVAVLLRHLGIPYTLIEREPALGGTWLVNKYPDCRVDITSHLYQFKFVKKYPWSEHFASAGETLRYLEQVAEEYDIPSHSRFNATVTGARWDEATATWTVEVEGGDGQRSTHVSNFIFNATGQFSTPKLPDIPGIADYRGDIFHTARWDTSCDFAGKRVAIIGNGATGSQLMPRIAEAASHLAVYQRTPQWIIPFEGYKEKLSFEDHELAERIPFYWNWYCYSAFVRTYQLQHLTVYDPEWRAKGGMVSEANDRLREVLLNYIREKVGGDEEKVRLLTPPFPPLARRMLVDNGWYDALERENVELVATGIDRFTERGIVSGDGIEREFDLVVLAAGFEVQDYMGAIQYAGRGGATPSDVWAKDGARAYLSILMPEFPNFFMFYGPNAQPRAGGHYSWAEAWARYAVNLAVEVIERGLSCVEVRQDAFERYNESLDEAAKINLRGPESKGSYYVNKFGRASVNVPWLAEEWYAMLAEPNFDHLTFR